MKIKLLLCSCMLYSFSTTIAQNKKLEKADALYDKFAYIDAIKTYQTIAENGHTSVDLLQKLGDAYYFNSEYKQANIWYSQLFTFKEKIDTEYEYRYAQTLKSLGEYAKADQMLAKFNAANPSDIRGKIFEKNRDYLQEIINNSGRYTIFNASINSVYSDYGSVLFGGKIIFASTRKNGYSQKVDKRNGQPFTVLYAATVSKDGTLGNVERFSSEINSKYHEATPAFTNDGKTMYFSRSAYIHDKKMTKNKKVMSVKLFKATQNNSKWTNEVELPFNSDLYSTVHPALSPDNRTLYFASDMPGSIGQSDIYSVSINGDGTYGIPVNLGKNINTEGRETFPFISDNNELYFSSDGHPGLGGLDIFRSKLTNSEFDLPLNIGAPVNGLQDDFAFTINNDTKTGYFSSNRESGKGFDDIYSLKENRSLENILLLKGKLTDYVNGSSLAGVKLSLFDQNFNLVSVTYTNTTGDYSIGVEDGKKYYLRAQDSVFQTTEVPFKVDISKPNFLSIKLNKKIELIPIGGNLLAAFGLRDIYFDLDKSIIRPHSAIDIEKIIEVMKLYPTIVVEIRSYTDSRGNFDYNKILSVKRAKATLEYMVKRGIKRDRLYAKGYGETKLLNKCSDGIICSDEEHEQNRRSEFVLIKME